MAPLYGTQVGNMTLSDPLETTHYVQQLKFPESHIINYLLSKLVRSRYLDIDLVCSFFCEFMDLDSVHKHVAKKEPGQYPALLYGYNSMHALIGWLSGHVKFALDLGIIKTKLSHFQRNCFYCPFWF